MVNKGKQGVKKMMQNLKIESPVDLQNRKKVKKKFHKISYTSNLMSEKDKELLNFN